MPRGEGAPPWYAPLMWFVAFVAAVGALISFLVFGSAAYLEATGSVNMAPGLNGPVPLPKPRPVSVTRPPEENERVREPQRPQQKHRPARRDI